MQGISLSYVGRRGSCVGCANPNVGMDQTPQLHWTRRIQRIQLNSRAPWHRRYSYNPMSPVTRHRAGATPKLTPPPGRGSYDSANVAESRRLSVEAFEFCRLVGSASCVSGGIRVRANAGKLAAIDDQIFVAGSVASRRSTPEFPLSPLRTWPAPTGMSRKYAVSCRDAPWFATDDPWARAAGTIRRLRSLRAGRFRALGRLRLDHRSWRARYSRDRRRVSFSRSACR